MGRRRTQPAEFVRCGGCARKLRIEPYRTDVPSGAAADRVHREYHPDEPPVTELRRGVWTGSCASAALSAAAAFPSAPDAWGAPRGPAGNRGTSRPGARRGPEGPGATASLMKRAGVASVRVRGLGGSV